MIEGNLSVDCHKKRNSLFCAFFFFLKEGLGAKEILF